MKLQNKNIQGKEFKTKYAIMTIQIATKDNVNNPNTIYVHYIGKGGYVHNLIDKYFISNSAYDRLSDAKRMLNSQNKNDEWQQNEIGGWTSKSSIIEINVEKERE